MRRAIGFASYLNGQARRYSRDNEGHNPDLAIVDFIGSVILIGAFICLVSLVAAQLYIRLQ
ncbi:MAG TPA: hypothetical protein GXX39_02295 [Syntrophothermus lipocalidus]|nr:hypothetical protein [Syntrophothermus lipocalidus]